MPIHLSRTRAHVIPLINVQCSLYPQKIAILEVPSKLSCFVVKPSFLLLVLLLLWETTQSFSIHKPSSNDQWQWIIPRFFHQLKKGSTPQFQPNIALLKPWKHHPRSLKMFKENNSVIFLSQISDFI